MDIKTEVTADDDDDFIPADFTSKSETVDDYQDEEEEEDIDGDDDDFMDGDYNPDDDDGGGGDGSEDDEDRVRYATWDPGAFPDRYKTDQAGRSDKNVKNPKANKEKVHYGGPKYKLIWRKGQVKKNGERYVNKDLFYFPQEGDR